MIKVADVYEAINSVAPFNTQLDFDNSGLLVGDANADVSKVAIALDATYDTVKAAIDSNYQLLITHHPVIFSPLKRVTTDDVCYYAIKNGLSIISAHTNLDVANGGVNDCLASVLGLKDIQPLTDSGEIPMGRVGFLNAVSAQSFAAYLKSSLDCGCVKFVANVGPIKKVAICGGAGGDFILAAKQSGADAYVTGECRHHERLLAKQLGIGLFECGHFSTEQFVKNALKILMDKIGLESVVIDEKDPADYL